MNTYILLLKLTDQGINDIKQAPERVQQGIKGMEALGGRMICFYAAMGKYDYVAIGEMPSDEAALAFALGLGRMGNVRTETLKAYTTDLFGAVVGRLP